MYIERKIELKFNPIFNPVKYVVNYVENVAISDPYINNEKQYKRKNGFLKIIWLF